MSVFVEQTAKPCAFTSSESWVVLSPIEQSIKHKIESVGTPLKDWNIQINYGIKTGCNEAFIINEAKRAEILANCRDAAERNRTEQIIRPILRGRDIKRYAYEWAHLYIIATFPALHLDIEDYPAIKRYLLSFGKERLEQTGKEYVVNGQRIKARKKSNNKWFETQDTIGYWDDFAKPKIVYPDIMRMPQDKTLLSQFPKFHLDVEGFFPEATVFFIVGERVETLCRFFASDVGFYTFTRFYAGPQFDDTGFRYKKEYFTRMPIPKTRALDNLANEKMYDEALCKVLSLSQEETDFIKSYKVKLLRA